MSLLTDQLPAIAARHEDIAVPYDYVFSHPFAPGNTISRMSTEGFQDELFRNRGGSALHALRRALPADLAISLRQFRLAGNESGFFLLGGVPIDAALPISSEASKKRTVVSETALLAVAAALGSPVGYQSQRRGLLVQNLVPRTQDAKLQVGSTSSKLVWHTEDAFDEYRPDFICLLCLRGDPEAITYVAQVSLKTLPPSAAELLCGERVVIGSDSARTCSVKCDTKVLTLGYPRPVVRFDPLFSFDLSDATRNALDVLEEHFESRAVGVTLKPGDLLIIDNMSAVHARSAFTPRYDGAERWLQRVSVVSREMPATVFNPDSSLLVCT